MAYSEINAMRKAGHLEEALQQAEREYALTPNKYTAGALFWCLNDDAKRCEPNEAKAVVERMRTLLTEHEPNNEMMVKVLAIAEHMLLPEAQAEKQGWEIYHILRQISLDEVDMRKRRLFQYLKLELKKPSLLHSLFMSEALKMDKGSHKGDFLFMKFTEMWGFDSFRDEDWEQRTNKEGQLLPSVVERVISACVKEMHEENLTPGEGFCQLLDKAIERFPKNNHLPRYAAQILARKGHTQEAVDAYKQLIRKLPDKFYLWDDLAELTGEPDLHLGLLCAAVTSGANDEFLVNIRLRMADLLCNRQLYSHAQTELNLYQKAHEYKGWPLKRRFYNVATRIPRGTRPVDNRGLYAHFKSIADEFIYSGLPSAFMVKTWEKKDTFGNKAVVSWQPRHVDQSIWLKPRTFRLDYSTPNGTIFEVKAHNGRVVWIREAELKEDLPWLRHVTGMLKIKRPDNGKLYGFVNDVFVPGPLLYSRSEGSQATVLAIQNKDNTWAALTLE
ncbi:MAG: hypothetical protein LIP03_15925 [Bacteroidales bacterium]|nr:hypothetical protein [Bacteroidales bacterium]